MAVRIVFIGAGSLDFNGPIFRSLMPLAARENLCFSLCDKDTVALAEMSRIVERLCEMHAVSVEVESHTELEPAVHDSSFVVITLNHGGLNADRADFQNAVDHGFFPKHVDTIGPAGWLRALRMGAFMDRLLSALPSGATVLTLSNPLALIVRMAHRRGFRAVGFCHGAMNRAASFKEWLGLSEFPTINVWGSNHAAWLTELRLGDRDVYPDLVRLLRTSPEHRNWRLNLELHDRYGTMPVLEAQHNADFFAGFDDAQSLKDYGLHLWEYEPRVSGAENRRTRRAAFASGETPLSHLHTSREGVAEVIEALTDGDSYQAILNTPLSDSVNGVPASAIVETRTTVDPSGCLQRQVPSLHPDLVQQFLRVHRQQDLAAEAFETGNLEKLVAAMMMEPNMVDEATARSMLSRALREHEAILPQAWQKWA